MAGEMIQSDPASPAGKPVVAGARIAVEAILEKLAAGETREQILGAHPDLTEAGIAAALTYAAQVVRASAAAALPLFEEPGVAVPPARDAAEARARHEANRAAWNEGAAYYTARVQETIEFLRGGGSSLHPIERANLGNLRDWCGTAIHLQCASGEDTLSLWVEGARRVVGVDISDAHIANARALSQALGAPAAWHRCDVLETPHELDGTADLVYTGRGALCWLHDLEAWAAVVARLLRPGGALHVFDDHPASWLFEAGADGNLVYSNAAYFGYSEASRGWPSTYIGALEMGVEQQSWKYERLWTLAEVFSALRGAGLTVERLGEHAEGYWESLPGLRPEQAGRIPLTFSVMARKTRGF